MVSTASIRIAGMCLDDDAVTMSAPLSPKVMTTFLTPARIKSRATSSGSAAAPGLRLVSTLASVWFGVSTSTKCNTEEGKGRTGAGFRIVMAPSVRARGKGSLSRSHRNFKLGEHYSSGFQNAVTLGNIGSRQEFVCSRIKRDAVVPGLGFHQNEADSGVTLSGPVDETMSILSSR